MASPKVLVFLVGTMFLFMACNRASAASLFEEDDDDDVLESLDITQGAAVEDANSLDETKFEDKAFDFDVKDLDDKDKRIACADKSSRTFCKKFRGYCRQRTRLAMMVIAKCQYSCHKCYK